MVSLSDLKAAFADRPAQEYQCQENLNLYDSAALTTLATQAVAGRQLRILSLPQDQQATGEAAIEVCLCEDDYPGWLPLEDLDLLETAQAPYQAIKLDRRDIAARLPQVIAYTAAALSQPNSYLWGGTVGPNYDCSGLMQAAFLSAGIWLPRDAYQQAAFAEAVALEQLQPGDLLFFGGNPTSVSGRAITHVGLYLGDSSYIHSSGKKQGRNGIGIDSLDEPRDAIASAYSQQLQGAGRVVTSYRSRLSG
jgi:cell wall-associated NlpC family hydrolase